MRAPTTYRDGMRFSRPRDQPLELEVVRSRILSADPAAAWRLVTSAEAELAHPENLVQLPLRDDPDRSVVLTALRGSGCSAVVLVRQPSTAGGVVITRDATRLVTRTVWMEHSEWGSRLHLRQQQEIPPARPGTSRLSHETGATLWLENYADDWLFGVDRIASGQLPVPAQRRDEASRRLAQLAFDALTVTATRTFSSDVAAVWAVLTADPVVRGEPQRESWHLPAGPAAVGTWRLTVAEYGGRSLAQVYEFVEMRPVEGFTLRLLNSPTGQEQRVALDPYGSGARVSVAVETSDRYSEWPALLEMMLDRIQERLDAAGLS